MTAFYCAPDAYFRRCAEHFQALQALSPEIEKAARVLADAAAKGNKILFCGNGGSAADSQHLAAELMGRYLKDRSPLAAAALTVDTSALTAIGNDYGYQDVFSRQLRGLGRPGDVLVGLSTSGNSENVLRAVSAAREIGIATIGLTGGNGGKMSALCDVSICVPAKDTNHIQEMHIAVGHWLCGFVENEVC
jgi:D-sedoheptulose 7-phosphate isomerase